MASATANRVLCSNCLKAAGIVTCRGCRKDFCYRHVADHREELNQQMVELTTNHDQLQQTISKPNCHPFMKQIDIWEQNSIKKIHQTADDTREQLLVMVDRYRTKVADALALLTQELTEARNEDDYVETDLKEWTTQLDKLKADLAAAQQISLAQNDTSLIANIFINHTLADPFEVWCGDIQITDHGSLILHGPRNQIAAIYTKNDYSSGQHRFRFQIERLMSTQNLIFGIISNDMNINAIPIVRKVFTKSSMSSPGVYYQQNGLTLFSFNHSKRDFQINDIVEIQIDCDRRKIFFLNERTQHREEFSTNLDRCQLPWRMVIALLFPGDCIRFSLLHL